MKANYWNSQNICKLDSIYLDISGTWWKNERIHDYLRSYPNFMQVNIFPYPDLIPDININREKYVRSMLNYVPSDNLLNLPRKSQECTMIQNKRGRFAFLHCKYVYTVLRCIHNIQICRKIERKIVQKVNKGGILIKKENVDIYLAHISPETGEFQSVEEHLSNVANLSEKNCPLEILKNIAWLNGILHDAGKLGDEFQEYMDEVRKYGDEAKRRHIDHSTAGGRLIIELEGKSLATNMISTAVYSHHGLQDAIEMEGRNTLEEQREEKDIPYQLVQNRYFQIYDKNLIKEKFAKAEADLRKICLDIKKVVAEHKERKCGSSQFYIGMYERLLLSILIDSDWTDTSSAAEGKELPERLSMEKTVEVWEQSIQNFENFMISVTKKGSGPLDQCRQEISDICRQTAEKEKGMYRLTVPTGAGKTLSSLRFALYHAKKFRKQHIIYVAPFNSILEQNAEEIKNAVGNPQIVLEYHCNVVHEEEQKEREYRKLTETWDIPIIVTTAVQVLNTLFSDQKSSIRRMHALCNSVIIFDEVQAFPTKCMELFNLAVNFLSYFCNSTIVLCSATQPTLAKLEENNIFECEEMVTSVDQYGEIFKRTVIEDKTGLCKGGMTLNDFDSFLGEQLKVYNNVLAIVNTKKCARELYQMIKEKYEGYEVYHLSNNMCAAHRQQVLSNIKDALNARKRIICVSTQLVEAGVNFSFECVIRSLAGLDSVIQCAGRCNRHKELEGYGKVYIVKLVNDLENLSRLEEIRVSQRAMQKVLDQFSDKPEVFGNALDSWKSIKLYYRYYLEGLRSDETKFPVSKPDTTLVELLGKNLLVKKQYQDLHGGRPLKNKLVQAFKTAGEKFKVISEDNKVQIVIPYDSLAKDTIEKLQKGNLGLGELIFELRKLQRYTVGISENLKSKLGNAIGSVCEGQILVLADGYYDKDIGVLEFPKMSDLIM